MELNLDNLNVTVPLRQDEGGAIRIGKGRLLLYIVIDSYKSGSSPEEIIEMFDTLKIGDAYAVIAYYHQHKEEIDAYINWIHEEGERIRKEIEASYTPEQHAEREKLFARLRAYREQMKQANK